MTATQEFLIGDFIVPEYIIPQPEQLQKISSAVLMIAQESKALKGVLHPRTSLPVYYWIDGQYGSSNGLADGQLVSRSARYQHYTVATNVGELTPDSQIEAVHATETKRSLRYRSITEERLFDDIWRGQVDTYSFEWQGDRVLKSQRIRAECPSVEEAEARVVYKDLVSRFGDVLDDTDVSMQLELIAGMPTSRETNFVSREECAGLLRVMRLLRSEEYMHDAAA